MDGTEKVLYTRADAIKAYHDFPCLHFDTNPLLICILLRRTSLLENSRSEREGNKPKHARVQPARSSSV